MFYYLGSYILSCPIALYPLLPEQILTIFTSVLNFGNSTILNNLASSVHAQDSHG